MPYFSNLPRLRYSFDDGVTTKVAVDIMKRVKVRDYIKENTQYFSEYNIEDGDTPDTIAENIYGDSNLHWVVMIFNNIINPYYDMPLSQRELEAFCYNKYRGETWFLTRGDGTADVPNDFYLERNQTLRNVSGGGPVTDTTDITYGDNAALVRKWDKTLSSVEVIGISGDFAQGYYVVGIGTSADGTTYNMPAKITRRVQESIYALHHFQETGTSDVWLNPLGTPPQAGSGIQAVLGHTGGVSGEASSDYDYIDTVAGITNTLWYAYAVSSSDTYSVSNLQYEFEENEKKRTINLIKPQFVQKVVRDFEELMRG